MSPGTSGTSGKRSAQPWENPLPSQTQSPSCSARRARAPTYARLLEPTFLQETFWGPKRTSGFPKIWGTFLEVIFWGFYWGPPILANYHLLSGLRFRVFSSSPLRFHSSAPSRTSLQTLGPGLLNIQLSPTWR